MPIHAAPGEQYTVRRKVFKILGSAFHIYDENGQIAGYCKQRALKLREDLRVYTDDSAKTELLTLRARQVIDFGATYDLALPTGEPLVSFRRKGLKSSFVRDEWTVLSPSGTTLATLSEQGSFAPLVRRYGDNLSIFFPQRFHLVRAADGAHLATLRQHFNPLVYRLGVAIHADDPQMDELIILGLTCLIAAIEGRQG